MTFEDACDYWMFCGARVLTHKWERARILAVTDGHKETLHKIETKIYDEMRFDASRDGLPAPPQTAGIARYTGPVIVGRFQVLESFLPGHYYICDLKLPDLILRQSNNEILRFTTIADADAYVSQFTGVREAVTQPDEPLMEADPVSVSSETIKSVRGRRAAPVVVEPDVVEPDVAEPVVDSIPAPTRRGRKAATPVVVEPVADPTPAPTLRGRKAAAAVAAAVAAKAATPVAVEPDVVAPAPAPRGRKAATPASAPRGRKAATPASAPRGRKAATPVVVEPAAVAPRGRKAGGIAPAARPSVVGPRGFVGAYTQELLLQGLSTDAIIAALQKRFPDKANSVGNIAVYRSRLKKLGQLPTAR